MPNDTTDDLKLFQSMTKGMRPSAKQKWYQKAMKLASRDAVSFSIAQAGDEWQADSQHYHE